MFNKQTLIIIFLYLSACIGFSSCAASKKNIANNLSEIKELSGLYNNKPDSSEFSYLSLISQFNLKDSALGAIEVEMVSERELKLKFSNGSDSITRVFKGKYKDGFFEIILEKWTTGVPLINFRTKKEIIWLSKSSDSQLIIDRYTFWAGFIFVMSAGDSYESQHLYSKAVMKTN